MEMNKNEMGPTSLGLNDITEGVIGSSFSVINDLGSGFLEKVYENALRVDLKKKGFRVKQQHPIKIHYQRELVGEYIADLLVENRVLVELKAVQDLDDIHQAQCLNYLKATGFEICLLINFGKPELQIRRIAPRRSWVKIS